MEGRASLVQNRKAEMRSPLRETSASTDSISDRRRSPQRSGQWTLAEDTKAVMADMPPMMRQACGGKRIGLHWGEPLE